MCGGGEGEEGKRNGVVLWGCFVTLPPAPAQSQGYAFVELRCAEEASNALSLDGIMFQGACLKVWGRPSVGRCGEVWTGTALLAPALL